MNQNEFVRQISHADVLLSQGRYQQAASILERLLATGYEGLQVMKMMAIAKMGLGQYADAEGFCQTILSQHPDDAFIFYMLATIKGTERKYTEALALMDDAITMEPANADFHAFKSNILIQTKDYRDALMSADYALGIDAENINALNARASSLVALGRKEEAYTTIDKSLSTDPNNPDTHANMGWGLLHHGDSEKALHHFKEALRSQPTNEYAKSGMLEAMKSKFPLYRYFLIVMLWLGKMKGNHQWAFIIGGYIIYRVLVSLANHYENLQPLLIPLIAIIALFFISTWIFSPLMNLYLLTNPYGKFTLTDGQKESARYVGVALLVSILGLCSYFIFNNEGLLSTSIFAFALMIPLGTMNNPFLVSNKKKLRMTALVIVLFVMADSILSLLNNTFMSAIYLLPLLALVAYQWYTNYLLINE